MEKDTRRLTVAREHLDTAREELQRAIDNVADEIRQPAVQRAADHLALSQRRLDEERIRWVKNEGEAVERAFHLAADALQQSQDLLHAWRSNATPALTAIQSTIIEAMGAIDDTVAQGEAEVHMQA